MQHDACPTISIRQRLINFAQSDHDLHMRLFALNIIALPGTQL